MQHDPVENTPAFKQAMQKIEPILEREFPADRIMLGTCHRYWHRKKTLLAEAGITWHTPQELNPHIHFD